MDLIAIEVVVEVEIIATTTTEVVVPLNYKIQFNVQLILTHSIIYLDNRRYNNNGGGYQRRPYDRPPPEAKDDEPEDIESRLKSLIIKIGDKVHSFTL